MKKKIFKSMFALFLFLAMANVTFADVITPGEAISRKMTEGAGLIFLVVIGIAVVAAVSALVVIGMKKQGEQNVTKTNIEPVFGVAPKMEEKMEVNKDEKTNE